MATATYSQVTLAQRFLRSIGGDWHDNYIILVVVAWITAANRGWGNIQGNNPFLVRASAIDTRLRSGTFKRNGITYSRYASIDTAIAAAVLTLRRGANADVLTHYQPVLDAFRTGHGISGTRKIAYALTASAWGNPGQYITKTGKNLILVALSRFDSIQLQPPQSQPPKRPPQKKPKPQAIPPQLRYPLPTTEHEWPRPLAPLSFLHERQWVPKLWTDGRRLG